jgi:hypothetical protein
MKNSKRSGVEQLKKGEQMRRDLSRRPRRGHIEVHKNNVMCHFVWRGLRHQ